MSRMILLLLLSCPLWGQCVKQPPVALAGVEEWACADMEYRQAWDTLSAAGVAPVRPVRVSDLAIRGNYRSKKQTIIRALKVIGFGTGIVAGILINNDNNDLSDLQLGALISGPKVAEAGITFFSKAPESFTPLPDDNGFVTIYSLPTNQVIVGRMSAAPGPAENQEWRPNVEPQPVYGVPLQPKYHWVGNTPTKAQAETREVDCYGPSCPDEFHGPIVHPIPAELTGLLSTDDLANPRSESDMRWIAEYYRSRMNEAEAEAVLTRGYQVEMLVAVK